MGYTIQSTWSAYGAAVIANYLLDVLMIAGESDYF